MAFEDKVSICEKCGWEFLREPNEIIDRHVCDRCGADTPTAKARWVLIYIHFQIYSKVYETNEFL